MIKKLPDESCRKCGGLLIELSICAKCREPNQYVCRICGNQTLQQFHNYCFHEIEKIRVQLVIGGEYTTNV